MYHCCQIISIFWRLDNLTEEQQHKIYYMGFFSSTPRVGQCYWNIISCWLRKPKLGEQIGESNLEHDDE